MIGAAVVPEYGQSACGQHPPISPPPSVWGLSGSLICELLDECVVAEPTVLTAVAYRAAAMASKGIPLPPRTPTPPVDDDAPQQPPVGLGFEGELSAGGPRFDPNALSPMSATFPSKQFATLGPSDSVSQRGTPTLYTPASATFPYTPASIMSGTDVDAPFMSGTEGARNPFNFQSVTYQPGRPKQNVR